MNDANDANDRDVEMDKAEPRRDPARGADQDADRGRGRLNEAAMVGRAQEGDVSSFETLVRRYQGPVFGLAWRMLTDRGEAEDVVQDTFVTVWRRLPTLVDVSLFRAWVFQIATRRCLNVLRSRSRQPSTSTDTDAREAVSVATQPGRGTGGDPAVAVQHRAELAGLEVALQALPDAQRVCWVLREVNELTYPEIAYATHLPVSTVRGRIARARQNLMEGMDAWR